MVERKTTEEIWKQMDEQLKNPSGGVIRSVDWINEAGLDELLKQERVKSEMKLIESAVAKAWEEERTILRILLDKNVEKTEPICQGITANVQRRLSGLFHCVKFYFEPQEGVAKGKSHVALVVVGLEGKYVVDGTVKQFLPDEKRSVFPVNDYPLGKNYDFPHLQTWG